MPDDDKYFGVFPTRLRGLIESKKTTITALANALKISRQSVSQYQDGTGQPKHTEEHQIHQLFRAAVKPVVRIENAAGHTDPSPLPKPGFFSGCVIIYLL